MPTTIINDFSLEPKPAPPPPDAAPAAKSGGAKESPDAAREIERVLHHDRHRAARLWVY